MTFFWSIYTCCRSCAFWQTRRQLQSWWARKLRTRWNKSSQDCKASSANSPTMFARSKVLSNWTFSHLQAIHFGWRLCATWSSKPLWEVLHEWLMKSKSQSYGRQVSFWTLRFQCLVVLMHTSKQIWEAARPLVGRQSGKATWSLQSSRSQPSTCDTQQGCSAHIELRLKSKAKKEWTNKWMCPDICRGWMKRQWSC